MTAALVAALESVEQVAFVHVEDAPASRTGQGFAFLANEIYVGFRLRRTLRFTRLFGFLPVPAIGTRKSLTLDELRQILSACESIGPADYADEGMIQYLRSERVVPEYQTRGYKLVEMVRIYEVLPDNPPRQ